MREYHLENKEALELELASLARQGYTALNDEDINTQDLARSTLIGQIARAQALADKYLE